MVGTTVIPLNLRWFPHQRQFSVVVHELQCATEESPPVLLLLPTSGLKKTPLQVFPITYARTDLRNCQHVYCNETVFASALHQRELF